MFLRGIGLPELLIVLVIVLLLFGVGRVSKIGKELGSAFGSFRKSLNEETDKDPIATASDSTKDA